MKKRILFVDDEPFVLHGLQRMLRGLRREWDMAFVEGGEEALRLLNEQSFDVIVTDMRMPGMDGVQLLREVTRHDPRMVRIILSGQADQETIFKSVELAHQYLAKPCDADTLKSTVARAISLRDLLVSDALKGLVAHMDSLPSLPALYVRIVEELQKTEPSIRKAAKIISMDVGMTAKILQLVNSAFFGLRRHVSSPAEAVVMLGLDTIKALVLSVRVFSQFDQKSISDLSLDHVWSHSLMVGAYAKRIAEHEKADQNIVDDSLMAGLLHDVGKLILASNMPQAWVEAQRLAEDGGLAPWVAEQQTFGASHAEVGAYLLGLWGLPSPIVAAVAFHHRPHTYETTAFNPLAVVHSANNLAHDLSGQKLETPNSGFDMTFLHNLEIMGKIPVWRNLCSQVKAENLINL